MPRFNRPQILCWVIFASLTLVHAHVCTAQFTDNFSDGEFSVNPTWTEDVTANWIIENGRLQSNVSVASSTFYITTPSATAISAQWEFYVNLQFNTSGANYADVYLISANQNLNAAGNNGYFVRIGGTPDEISLYKITAGSPAVLINGTDGITNSSNNAVKIKVIRDANNLWTLSYDNTGSGNNYVSEPSITDNSFSASSFFGIRITQSTATFFKRHFFDDFYVGDIKTDTEPPALISATPISSTSLDILFSEKIDINTAEEESNYSVNNHIGQPQSATLQPDDKTVRLVFVKQFPNATTSQLSVVNVEDELENAMPVSTVEFFFFQEVPALYKDVIITEIFPDPSPVIGLPEAEFVELYNRGENVVDLTGWKLTDGSSTAILSGLFFPGTYRIVTASASASLFTSFGTVTGVANFPTLNNSGDNLELKRDDDILIDKVSYTDAWYQDEDKRQGGFTLELIDPGNPCGEAGNWIAAEAVAGGTPGTQNSVFENKPDLTGPELISAIPISANAVMIKFNEKLASAEPETNSFSITPEQIVTSVSFTDATLTTLHVNLEDDLQTGTRYTLTVQNIFDCNGNEVQTDFSTALFALPEPAVEKDLVINEILFNPRPTGIDFVEIYNTSAKYITLKNWSIANYVNEEVLNEKVISAEDILIAPGEYAVFTEDANVLKGEYVSAHEDRIFVVNDLPSFNDDEGTVALLDQNGNVVDFFSYQDDYHMVYLKDDEGVSLERISALALTNDAANWQSAGSSAGFATPGYINSNARGEVLADKVKIEPEIFEPIHGQPAFTQIHYNFSTGGYVANVKILDARGREVKHLVNNSTLGTTGFFRWDGDMNDGTKARTGYYIVWMEVFNASGKVDSFRKRVIVGSKF